MPSQALLQRGKKPYGLVMLFEEISERFSGKLWERAARLVRHGLYRMPSIIIELESLTMHGYAHQIRAPQTIYPNDVPMNCAYCHRSLISIDYVERLVGCLHLRAVTFCSRNGVNDMLLSRKINSVASSFRYDARQNPRLEAPSSAKGMRGGLFWPVMENAMVPKILVVGTAITAIAAFAVVSQPVQARSCYAVLAKGRGLDEATASARSLKHLTNRINHWAAKNKLGTVGVGHRSTVCSNQGVPVCTSSAKVCG